MKSGTARANTIETVVSFSIADFMQQKSIMQNLGATNFASNVGDLICLYSCRVLICNHTASEYYI
jgi:hypothetical protein